MNVRNGSINSILADWPVLPDEKVVPVISSDVQHTGRRALEAFRHPCPPLVFLRAHIQQWNPERGKKHTVTFPSCHWKSYFLLEHTVTDQCLQVACPCLLDSGSTSADGHSHWFCKAQNNVSSMISTGEPWKINSKVTHTELRCIKTSLSVTSVFNPFCGGDLNRYPARISVVCSTGL